MIDEHYADLKACISRVEGRQELILEHVIKINNTVEDDGDRIDSLESTRDKCKGAMKIVAALVAATGAVAIWFNWVK